MTTESVSGKALPSALADGSLDVGGNGFLVAIVKKTDSDDSIHLSQTGCSDWIEVPTKMIRSAKGVGTAICEGLNYPILLIELAETKDPFARVAYRLLSQMHTTQKGEPKKSGCACSTTEPIKSSARINLGQTRVGGLGQFGVGGDCTVEFRCYECTRCIPFTDACWTSTCCDITGGSCTGRV